MTKLFYDTSHLLPTSSEPHDNDPLVRLWVYGTLRPGLPLWESWLAGMATDVQEDAVALGALWMTPGWSYPWFTTGSDLTHLNSPTHPVKGTLVTVPASAAGFESLCRMEVNAGYRLTSIEVTPPGGRTTHALAFVYPHIAPGFELVPGQDWRAYVEDPINRKAMYA